MGGTRKQLNEVKDKLKRIFKIRDLGSATYFLGMEIMRDRKKGTIVLSQAKATADVVSRYGQSESKGRNIPMDPSFQLGSSANDADLLSDDVPYRALVGSLLYIANCTRPDIAYAVGVLCRHMNSPTKADWNAAKGVVKYLSKTQKMGITYTKGGAALVGYTDSDYGGDTETRRSTTGYAFILGGGAVSWNSKLQPVVAMSTAEAEYMAASMAVKEALWLRLLLHDFGILVNTLKMKCDNQAAIAIARNPIISQRAKHIDIQYHFIRERIERKEVDIAYVESAANASDILTKALGVKAFERCRFSLGLA
jgi:hypothetical protein